MNRETYKIDEMAAEVVRRIFKEFLGGKGTYQIAKLLNQEGIPTPGIHLNMSNVVNNITNTTNIWRHTTVKTNFDESSIYRYYCSK